MNKALQVGVFSDLEFEFNVLLSLFCFKTDHKLYPMIQVEFGSEAFFFFSDKLSSAGDSGCTDSCFKNSQI